MAETQSDKNRVSVEKKQDLTRQQTSRSPRRTGSQHGELAHPFQLMDRMAEEMDRWFDRATRSLGISTLGSTGAFSRHREGVWFPRIEAAQKGDTFVVRADLPGLKKDDIDVHLTEDAITIHGERRAEHEEDSEGYWRSEREYGEFHRTIPLPEGTIAESAKATFRDGVLEISMQAAPSEANRGRQLEITDAPGNDQKT